MKKFLLTLICILLIGLPTGWAIDLPLPNEPPVQVSGVEIEDNLTKLVWDANTESDLAGYTVSYSVNTSGYVYNANQIFDVGNVTFFEFASLPASIGQAGTVVFFGLSAYDTSDNVSGTTAITDGGEDLKIFFDLNRPPANPSGGRLEQ